MEAKFFPAEQIGTFRTEGEAVEAMRLPSRLMAGADPARAVALGAGNALSNAKLVSGQDVVLIFASSQDGNVSVWRSAIDWAGTTVNEARDAIENFEGVSGPGLWTVFELVPRAIGSAKVPDNPVPIPPDEFISRLFELDRDEQLWDSHGFRASIAATAAELIAAGESLTSRIPEVIENGRWGSGVVAWVAAYELARKGNKAIFLQALKAVHKAKCEKSQGWSWGNLITYKQIAAVIKPEDLAPEIEGSLAAGELPLRALETLVCCFPKEHYTEATAEALLKAEASGAAKARPWPPNQSVARSLSNFGSHLTIEKLKSG